jgi:hypothetical protein
MQMNFFTKKSITSINVKACAGYFSKIWLFCLSLLFVFLSLNITARAATTPIAFKDLPAEHISWRYITYLQHKGVVGGFPDGTFRPAAGITRAQAVKMLVALKGLPLQRPRVPTFSDVPATFWAFSSIETAAKAGLVKGYPNGLFLPNVYLTRAETAALLFRLAEESLPLVSGPYLRDVAPDSWAYRSVLAALDAGFLGLTAEEYFSPHLPANRACFAQGLVLVSTLAPQWGGPVGDLTALLVPKQGQVRLVADPVTARPELVVTEKRIAAGARIITAADGMAELLFDDGSSIWLEPGTEITLTKMKGSLFILPDGTAGRSVDEVYLSLQQGEIFGGLATRILYQDHVDVIGTAVKTIAFENSGLINPANRPLRLVMLPGRIAGGAVSSAKLPWWKAPFTKKVRVVINMPWGVAGIKGTFWENKVTAASCIINNLCGETEVSAGEQTVLLGAGQRTEIKSATSGPTPPAALTGDEILEWQRLKEWVVQRAAVIEKNAPVPPAPVPETPGQLQDTPPFGQPALKELVTLGVKEAYDKLDEVTPAPKPQPGSGSVSGGSSGGSSPVEVAAPLGTPEAGIYQREVTVSLQTTTPGATIYYTTDGSEPAQDGKKYIEPFRVTASTTIKAVAVKDHVLSSVSVFSYLISSPAPPVLQLRNNHPIQKIYRSIYNLRGKVFSDTGPVRLWAQVNFGTSVEVQLDTENVFQYLLTELSPGLNQVVLTARDNLGQETKKSLTLIHIHENFILDTESGRVTGCLSRPFCPLKVELFAPGKDLPEHTMETVADASGCFDTGEPAGGYTFNPGSRVVVTNLETGTAYKSGYIPGFRACLDITKRRITLAKPVIYKKVAIEALLTPPGTGQKNNWVVLKELTPTGSVYSWEVDSAVAPNYLQQYAAGDGQSEGQLWPRLRVVAEMGAGCYRIAFPLERKCLKLDMSTHTLSGDGFYGHPLRVMIRVERGTVPVYIHHQPVRKLTGRFQTVLPARMSLIPGDIVVANNDSRLILPRIISETNAESIRGQVWLEGIPAGNRVVGVTLPEIQETTGGRHTSLTIWTTTDADGCFTVPVAHLGGPVKVTYLDPFDHQVTVRVETGLSSD